MAEMTFRGNAGTEPGPGPGETTHRIAFTPGGADQAALLKGVLADAPTGGTWHPLRIEDAGPEVIACLVTRVPSGADEGTAWLLAAVADFEMRVRITLELIAEDNRGPDDDPYVAELSRRGWVNLQWVGPAGQETQVAAITDAGRLALAG